MSTLSFINNSPQIQRLKKKNSNSNNVASASSARLQNSNIDKILLKKFYNSNDQNNIQENTNININECYKKKDKLFQSQKNTLFNQYSIYNKYSAGFSEQFIGNYPFILNLITHILYKYIYNLIIALFEDKADESFLSVLDKIFNYEDENKRDIFLKKKIIVIVNNLFKSNNITTFTLNHFIYNINNHITKNPIVIINYFIHIFINTFITKKIFSNKDDICFEIRYNCNMHKNARQWIFNKRTDKDNQNMNLNGFKGKNSLEFILYNFVGYLCHFIHIRKRTINERQIDIKKKNLPNDIEDETMKNYLSKLKNTNSRTQNSVNNSNSNLKYNSIFFDCKDVNELQPDKNNLYLIRHKFKCIEKEHNNTPEAGYASASRARLRNNNSDNTQTNLNSNHKKKINEYEKKLNELLKNSNILNGYSNKQSGGWTVPGKWVIYKNFTNFLVTKVEYGYRYLIEKILLTKENVKVTAGLSKNIRTIIFILARLLAPIHLKLINDKHAEYNKLIDLCKDEIDNIYKIPNNIKNIEEYKKNIEEYKKNKTDINNDISNKTNIDEINILKKNLNNIYDEINKNITNINIIKKNFYLYKFFYNNENKKNITDLIEIIIKIYYSTIPNTKTDPPIAFKLSEILKNMLPNFIELIPNLLVLKVYIINSIKNKYYNELYDTLHIFNLILKYDYNNDGRKTISKLLDINIFPQNLPEITQNNNLLISGGTKKNNQKKIKKHNKIKKIIYKHKNTYLYNNFNTN
jgi:hypothetical protein